LPSCGGCRDDRRFNRSHRCFSDLGGCWVVGRAKQLLEIGLDRETRQQLVALGAGFNQGGIRVQLFAPNQTVVATALDDWLEELPQDGAAVALTDAGQAGVVGQSLMQLVAEIPAHTEAVGATRFQLALRAQALEAQEQLEFDEHDRVNRGPTERRVTLAHQVADEGHLKRESEVAVAVNGWKKIVQRDVDHWLNDARLNPDHG
jgi:hypothetical protein